MYYLEWIFFFFLQDEKQEIVFLYEIICKLQTFKLIDKYLNSLFLIYKYDYLLKMLSQGKIKTF